MALVEEMEDQGNFLFKYRGQLPIVILFVGLGILIYRQLNGSYTEPTVYTEVYKIFCIVVCLFGQFIRALTIGYTPKSTSGRNTQKQVAEELNSTGIYSIVRHPLYVGNYFMWLGICMLIQDPWFVISFTLLYWVYYERIMFAEEQFLRGKFGDTYVQWSLKTPAFIPKISQWVPSKLKFSMRNIIKREYYGFVSIFVVAFAFEAIKEYMHTQTFVFGDSHWDIILLASLFIFIFVRILAKKTNILNVENR